MNWITLHNNEALNQIKEESKSVPVLIYKHSTRCSLSSMALNRLERSWEDQHMSGLKPYFLVLISHRNLSDQVEEEFGVQHQSPQVIVIKDGKAIYTTSHMAINYHELKAFVKN